MIILLTDGAPTAGETDGQAILKNAKRRNGAEVRIFSFGVGYDVNSMLLDKLSLDNGGTADYIKPQEDIEVKVTSFFSKVSEPVLTDVSISIDGVKVTDIYPNEIPDIFNGQQVVVFGRYNKGGKATIRLSGETFDDRTVLVHKTRFNKRNRGYDFIPRLWANRKISYLLTEIRLHGENDELIDEVVALSKEHGIITPYTSYLILEHRRELAPAHITDAVTSFDHVAGGSAMKADQGKEAFMASRELKKGRDKSVLEAPSTSNVSHIGRKTFYRSDDGWIDADYEKDAETIEIEYLSDEYFELMKKHPEIGKYLSLGSTVTFVLEGKAYKISE
jgi:Ca-activated chloride channel family protein